MSRLPWGNNGWILISVASEVKQNGTWNKAQQDILDGDLARAWKK